MPPHSPTAATEAVRVVLVDDHDLLRRGMKTMLSSEDGIEVVGEAADGESGVTMVADMLPDVVLIDVIMPKLDGIEATRRIKDAHPNVGVVVLTGHDERRFLLDAVKVGASGYLLKSAELEDVVAAVRAAATGNVTIDPDLASEVLSQFRTYKQAEEGSGFVSLTPRETQILEFMSNGMPNKTIAVRLKVSERTVTTHIANIYSKLQVNNRVSAVQEAMRRRILNYTP